MKSGRRGNLRVAGLPLPEIASPIARNDTRVAKTVWSLHYNLILRAGNHFTHNCRIRHTAFMQGF